MSLPGLPWTIAEAARRFADRTAYVAPGGWSLSYNDVDRLSDEVAVGLVQRGVRAGDVVGVVLPAVGGSAVRRTLIPLCAQDLWPFWSGRPRLRVGNHNDFR